MMLDDDDSENDSDFVPEEEEEKHSSNQVNETLQGLSFRRKRKVDELYQEMRKADDKEVQSKLANALCKDESFLYERPSKKVIRRIAKVVRKIVQNNEGNIPIQRQVKSDTSNILQQAKELASKIQRKTVVVETQKFAGESIQ